jgi:hypothetical protein
VFGGAQRTPRENRPRLRALSHIASGHAPKATRSPAASPVSAHARRRAGRQYRAAYATAAAKPGATQTQWWSQLIGETSSPVSAVTSSAGTSWPAWASSAAAAIPRARATAAATAQYGVPAAMLPASRVMTARSDWLPAHPVKPVRSPLRNTPCSHQVAESAGSTAKPIATVAPNPARHATASRNRRVASR